MDTTQDAPKPAAQDAPKPAAQTAVNLPTVPDAIDNPVLPPEMGSFLDKLSDPQTPKKVAAEPEKVAAEPKKKEEAPKKVEDSEIADDDDEPVNPLLKNMLGEEEEDEPDVKAKDKKPDAKEDGEDGEELPELPEGDLKGKEAGDKVRHAFTTQRKQLTAKIEALEKKMAERTGTEAPPEVTEKLTKFEEENKSLKEQLEQQEKYVQLASLESSKVFRETIKAPIEDIKSDIVRISRDNGGAEGDVPATEIWMAIQKGDRAAINAILPHLAESDKIDLMSLEKDYRSIKSAEKSLRENSKIAQDEFDKARVAQQEEASKQSKAAYDAAFGNTLDRIKTKGGANLFKEVEGADDWNAAVQDANKKVESFKSIHPGQLSVEDVGTLLASHVVGPLLRHENSTLKAEVNRLRARMKQRVANTPGAGTGSGKAPAQEKAPGTATMPTPEEFINSRGR